MPYFTASLKGLDKVRARFEGNQIAEKASFYAGDRGLKPVFDVMVYVDRETWEDNGSPTTITVVLDGSLTHYAPVAPETAL